jgi:glycosyltransferase involved in cell wall biosynthesis
MTSVSVIIPTYNRAEMLAQVLPSYLQFAVVGEVLIVDDGCTDGTADLVAGLAQVDPRIKALKHRVNQGMTYAPQHRHSECPGRPGSFLRG